MRYLDEEGQAVVLLAAVMSIFLGGAIGLALDGSYLYAQRQMAQTAADAAAEAGIMSIFDGTNSSGTAAFSTERFTCTTTDARTPCVYASNNGFGGSASDTVTVSFPADSVAPGVTFSGSDPVNLIQVTVQRIVNTAFMSFMGLTATTVSATAMAGITTVLAPTPILITHPTLANALSMNGSTEIKICGGPGRSIEINSSNSQAYAGSGTIDLSQAGPADSGNCTTGTGADFGVFGGQSTNPGAVMLGSTGHYLSPASPMQDPLASVAAPTVPAAAGTTTAIANGTDGCTNSGGCVEYSPGTYNSLIPGKKAVIFQPGLYYIQGGGVDFKQTTGGGANFNAMCVGCAADPNTGTGMTIYDTVPAGTGAYPGNTNRPTGGFTIDTQASLILAGANNTATVNGNSVPGPPYYGILFWEDRTANAQTHSLGQGNGCFTLIGTIYITNTQAIMKANPAQYQAVTYNGTPCSTTVQLGDIIAGTLTLGGTVSIEMQLEPYAFLNVRQVALVE